MGRIAQGPELGSQPVAEGGLSRGGRSGDHHQPLVPGLCRLLGNIADGLFLECFLHQDQIRRFSFRDQPV